jgi:hypothetical protein
MSVSDYESKRAEIVSEIEKIKKSVIKLTVRISHNFIGGYDYYEKTILDLETDYCIYSGHLFSKKFIQQSKPQLELTWLNGVETPTAAELFNCELISFEDDATVTYCKNAYQTKYGNN